MKNIIKPKLQSYNINLQINFPNSKKDNWHKLWKLDKKLIGTKQYMGFAWFWDHEIKHYMRESSAKDKKYIHDCFLLNKIPLMQNKFEKGYYFKSNKLAEKIVNDYFENNRKKMLIKKFG
tara:strand:+ start:144 stop:503 length:360 start_codon:yes stop_codon:yes gene_type:complete